MKKLRTLLLTAAIMLTACGNGNSSGGDSDSGRGITQSPLITMNAPEAPVSDDILVYFDDTWNGDWFTNPRPMLNGAQEAYDLTGVKFGIWACNDILDDTNPSDAALAEFTEALYEVLFEDSEEYLLIVLIDLDNGDFAAWHVAGSSASVAFDDEAMELFYSYLSHYWDLPDRYTESEMFGLSLSAAAKLAPSKPADSTSGTHKNANGNIVTPLSEIGKFSVFWGNTGDRVHIDPDCWSFGSVVLFGLLNDARNAERYEWCGSCSREYRGDDGYGGDERFLREGNPNIQ